VRAVLAGEPTFAGELIEPPAAALLAPLITPPMTAEEAAGLDLILEGFLLHHGTARHLSPAAPGREVLAGDYCYAYGLVRIAAAGDLFVVEALADLIALGAGLVASDDRDSLVTLWRATTAVIAARGGPSAEPATESFLAGRRALRERGDVTGLDDLAATLPPTPGLAEALAR
jgi:hypothetical protein